MKHYFSDLTGVRALAAWLIFFNHYGSGPLVLEFHVGVTIFFVLSGFLITYRYYPTLELKRSWFKDYYVRRIARIYPMLFLTTLLTFWLLKDTDPIHWLLSLTLLKAWFSKYIFIDLSQAWTLTVEETFYVLAPLIYYMLKRRINLWLIFTVIFGLGLLVTSRGHFTNPSDFIVSHLFWLRYTFFGHAFDFFIGIALALALLKGLPPKFAKGFYTVGSSFAYGGATLLGLGLMAAFVWQLVNLQSTTYRLGALDPLGVIINNFFFPAATAVFFYGLVTEKTLIQKFLASKPMDLLGKASYTFYLIHLEPIANLMPWPSTYNIWTLFLGLNLAAIIIYLVIEKPTNKLVRSMWL